MKHSRKLIRLGAVGALTLIVLSALPAVSEESSFVCHRTIKAQVIALDQPWMWNRLGAAQPGGMIYALREDVVKMDGSELTDPAKLSPDERRKLVGNVRLRDDRRARPLVLRANKGDCLEITFWNLLSPEPPAGTSFKPKYRPSVQANVDVSRRLDVSAASAPTRWAGIHATGIELVGNIDSDASWIGKNPNSLAKPGEVFVYKWYAAEEGTFLIYSPADMESGQQAREGLFGAINVEPEGAEWYRSQVNHDDLDQATLTRADLKQPYFTLE
jgi:manganese oxidase